MGAFKKYKLNETKLRKGGVYFNSGFTYGLEILKMEVVDTRKKGDMFVCEFKILESNDPSRKVGTTVNYATLLNNDAAGPNIKELLVAASGIDRDDDDAIDDNDWDEIAEGAISKEQPFKGEKVRNVTRDHTTQEGKVITVCQWSPA